MKRQTTIKKIELHFRGRAVWLGEKKLKPGKPPEAEKVNFFLKS
jgi:hypothetical protein